MALASDTRPASGSEHIFSHYMVESALMAGLTMSHGVSVGFGTLISTLLYQYLLDELRPSELEPIAEEMRGYLLSAERVRDLLAVSGIGFRAEDFLSGADGLADMIRGCCSPDKRYTVLRFLSDRGHIGDGIEYAAGALKN
jgi:glycerol-1-phosphate dehydrogenase [NAD(P)+]